MKISAVSGDLVVKLALVAGALLAVAVVVQKVANGGLSGLPDLPETLDPTSTENAAYKAANVLTGGSSDPNAPPLGARIFNALHPDEFASWRAPLPSASITASGAQFDALGNRIN